MEQTEAPAAARDGQGRWTPGQSGNPAGKKPGTRNHASLLRDALRDGEDGAAVRVVIDKAVGGHFGAARFVVDGLAPRPRGRLIDLELPDGAGIAETIGAIVRRMCDGQISAEEALALIRAVDRLSAVAAAATARATAGADAPAADPLTPAARPVAAAPRATTARPQTARAAAAVKPPPTPAFGLHLQAEEHRAAPPSSLTAALLASTAAPRAAL
ncbi:MAG: hypothetical protein HY060_02880 [Proteobacteria bacterium]|nr:hypothetical protein [Pseudomonadota bacterium]